MSSSPERDQFPRAIVPEHLTARRLSNLPLDTPALIPLAAQDDGYYYARPTLFVDGERNLRARQSTEIKDGALKAAKSPMGRAGIMRVALIDEGIRMGTVADLRFITTPIPEIEDEAPDDTEESRDWFEQQRDSIAVDAFIANDPDSRNGAYYGAPEFYPALDRLRKHGNKALQSYTKRKRASNKSGRPSEVGKKTPDRQPSAPNSGNDTTS